MVEQELIKWEGEITEEIKNVTPQQLWTLIEDFGSLNKLFSHVDKCWIVEGTAGKPGAVRYCESESSSGSGTIQYAKEKLLMVDPSEMCLSYELIENSVGLNAYVATIKLFPMDGDGDGDDGKCGCKFMWTFVADPVEGLTQEAFIHSLKSIAQGMVTKMEETFPQT